MLSNDILCKNCIWHYLKLKQHWYGNIKRVSFSPVFDDITYM